MARGGEAKSQFRSNIDFASSKEQRCWIVEGAKKKRYEKVDRYDLLYIYELYNILR